MNQQSAPYSNESDIEKHYFTSDHNIYTDKLSKFAIKCDKENDGAVIDRLSRIYTHIFVDEVQDLAGYDLEFLRLLFESKIDVLLVGDPRQATYSTNNASKHKRFRKTRIISFFQDPSMEIDKDDKSLTRNFRCIKPICNFSNKLFPDLPQSASGNSDKPTHAGVFLVRKKDLSNYLDTFHPIQLRHDIRTPVDENYSVRTFGESKGLSFDRVLIYPTNPFIKWLTNNDSELAPTSRSKYYVALTRARHSVGILYDYDRRTKIDGVEKYIPQ